MGLFNWGKKKTEKKAEAKKDVKRGYSGISSPTRRDNSFSPPSSSSDDTITTALWLSSMSDDTPSHSYHDSSPSYDSGGYDGASDGDGGGADW